ncbi:hypothetical protein Q0F99_14655 [Rathayibacter oskolensis]|uniref:hypothetical protein n=1 Tax=Rathayibacter oskolensis TaxID=1891671 RepID=UPI00265E978D|nr:hypothetical protein [Rathayibacter oskolensis]WKK70949.1 hypothetical protein Q0F99_14655 [Rathayibacter oskolensis]
MDRFAAALSRHGVRYHILGIGGLLRQPEIADLVAALTVVEDPAAGSELVRLLAGARWRLGVRDLKALRDLASWLASRDHAHRLLPEEVRERMRASVTEGEGGSIVEALDFIASRRPGRTACSTTPPSARSARRGCGACTTRARCSPASAAAPGSTCSTS